MTKLANLTIEQEADLLQNMPIEQLNQLFSNGKTVVLSKDFTEELAENDLTAKAQLTGLPKDTILLIETDKTKAALGDVILYCQGLNIPLINFLQDEGPLLT